VTAQGRPYLVAVDENDQIVIGYANAHVFREVNGAYRHKVEITLSCHADHTGKGVGSRLLGSLLHSLKQKGTNAQVGTGHIGGSGDGHSKEESDAEVKQVLAVMAVDETGKENGLKLKEFYEGFGFQMVCDRPA
jgi:phosphinothricin acetyltransferase